MVVVSHWQPNLGPLTNNQYSIKYMKYLPTEQTLENMFQPNTN